MGLIFFSSLSFGGSSCPGQVIPDLDGAIGTVSHTFHHQPLQTKHTDYYYFTPREDGDFKTNITVPKQPLFIFGGDKAHIKFYKTNCSGSPISEIKTNGNGSLFLANVKAGDTIIVAITNLNDDDDYDYDVRFDYTTHVVTNADDMCYEQPVTTSGPYMPFHFCMNMFFFDFGMNCQENIKLRNIGNQHDDTDGTPKKLENVKFLVDRSAMFSMRLFQGCTQDGSEDGDSSDNEDESCQNGSSSFFPSMHIFNDDDVTYNLGNMGPNGSETVAHWDLIHMAMFASKKYYATYQKWVDGKLLTYIGEVHACEGLVGSIIPGGPFDAYDTFRNVSDRNISTKIAGKPFDLTIAALKNNRTELHPSFSGDVTVALKDGNGNSVGVPSKSMKFSTSDHSEKTWSSLQINKAAKGVHATFTFCADYDGANYTIKTCTSSSAQLGCTDKGKGYHTCSSSDSFAVRPAHLVIGADDSSYDKELLISGKEYNLSIQAYNDDNTTLTSDYNTTYQDNNTSSAGISIGQTLRFANGNVATGTQMHGTLRYSPNNFYSMLDGVSEFNGTKPYVAGIVFDDVGKVTARFTDKTWAAEDKDDTPQKCGNGEVNGVAIPGAFTCGNIDLTFIPDHFKIENVHLHNHNKDSNITYLSNDLNMSASVDLIISARNANHAVTQNFRQGSGYYEHNMTVDLNVTDWDSSNLGVNTRHPDGTTQPQIHDITTPVKLGFGGTDPKGKHHIAWNDNNLSHKLMFNYPRTMNVPVNPFVVPGSDINISVAATYTSSSGGSATVKGTGTGDKKATFLYARAESSKYLYDDVTGGSILTPISVVVYCDKWPATATNCPGIDTINGQTHEHRWFLSTSHKTSAGDGKITLAATNGTISPSIVTLAPSDQGRNNTITVRCTANNTVDIDFVQTNPTDTNSWLIYNKDFDGVPSPFYRVHCIGTGTWGGSGKTGHVVGGDTNTKKTHRLGW